MQQKKFMLLLIRAFVQSLGNQQLFYCERIAC